MFDDLTQLRVRVGAVNLTSDDLVSIDSDADGPEHAVVTETSSTSTGPRDCVESVDCAILRTVLAVGRKWQEVSDVLARDSNMSFTSDAVRHRHNRLLADKKIGKKKSAVRSQSVSRLLWSADEDRVLLGLPRHALSWQQIADRVGGSRTPHSCRNRVERLQKVRVRSSIRESQQN